jgi:histidine ammonia-lyase
MPQVHGAVRGALAHCEEVLGIESGSATDNPLVFADDAEVLSGGNFMAPRSRWHSTTQPSR